MTNKNLEIELRRFEISSWNDTITYEQHNYNDFSGAEGDECYCKFLDEVYNVYFIDLRTKIDTLVIGNNDLLLKFIQSKINLFNDIKADFQQKNYLDYDSHIQAHNREMLSKQGDYNVWRKIKNDRDTLLFFKEMADTQICFIEKAIVELNGIHDNYINDKTVSPQSILQVKQSNSKNHVDEYFERHFANKDITNKEIEMMFDITRPTVQAWREDGKLLAISEEGKRPIKYSKEALIEAIKDGKIKDRLVDIH